MTQSDFHSDSFAQLVEQTLAAARRKLLAERGEHGHWEGELSTSALSTAVAVVALKLTVAAQGASADDSYQPLIAGGLRWLADNQNADGGWGDTVLSFSNISTTALCWAAFAGSDAEFATVVEKTEAWLTNKAGGLASETLAKTIADRYGKDRTFSVPILTTLAITGRLSSADSSDVGAADRRPWKLIPRLPFELAAFPHSWFAAMRLPVVSYALPALIAIGQLLHQKNPTWFLPLRWFRNSVIQKTLRKLQSIQPTGGGFLEATPLTSFVVISLVGAGRVDHPVVKVGLDFIVRSVRPDGSWPIDTNLATWVTTLSTNALGAAEHGLADVDTNQVTAWLLGQQYRDVHPYTQAKPGGWAWTDLPGGVPDADDTPGALLALHKLKAFTNVPIDAVEAGINWLLDLQNGNGGVPTFCKGWGALPFDRSSQDLTAHCMRAWLTWREEVNPKLQARTDVALGKAIGYLADTQREDGAWVPLWFGNQHSPVEENPTYGTSRVILALGSSQVLQGWSNQSRLPSLQRGIDWLLAAQNEDGGWGGDANTPSSLEETSLVVEALATTLTRSDHQERMELAIARGTRYLCEHTHRGERFDVAPIGFYFAKLWYFEKLYPLVYGVAALSRVLECLKWKCKLANDNGFANKMQAGAASASPRSNPAHEHLTPSIAPQGRGNAEGV